VRERVNPIEKAWSLVKAPSKKQKKPNKKLRMEPPFSFASYQRKRDHSLKADLEIIGL
jgi:hypothetical protein